MCICWHLPSRYSTQYGEADHSATTLLNDIKRIQSDDAFLDMVFVCGSQEEEEEIRACRMLVASRSPVLQTMLLTSGMAESRSTRIPLPDIHPIAMRICLEFFHTDTVQESSWPNISMAMHVLKAAMFFLIERLQIIALKYFAKTLTFASKDDAECWASLATCYNLAVELYSSHSSSKIYYDCRIHSFLREFCRQASKHVAGCSNVNLFSGSDSERRFYKKLTEPALFYFIQGVQVLELPIHGFSQYLCFLHVVRWNAYRVVVKEPAVNEDEFEKVLNKCFPRSSEVMLNILSVVSDIPFNDSDVSKYLKLLAGPLADCLKRAPIDFAKMPSHILCRFIEPLDVVSPSTLLAAYRCQTLCWPHLMWDELGHGKQYKLENCDPSIISCSSSELQGFARCSTRFYPAVESFLDWEVVIWDPCNKLRIGFCLCKPTFRVSECSSHALGDRELSWALSAGGFLHACGRKSSARYIARDFVEKNAVIQVRLDMVNKSCSFSIDGKDAGVAWSGLSLADDYALYPAISLVSPGTAEVRRVHHSWIDNCPSKRACPSTSHATPEGGLPDDSLITEVETVHCPSNRSSITRPEC